MSDASEERGRQRRLFERYECELPITLVVDEETHFSGRVLDISLGGMFVGVDTPIDYGTTVRALFQVPGLRRDSDLECIVRWARSGGIGLQFVRIRAYEVWGLNQLFRQAEEAA